MPDWTIYRGSTISKIPFITIQKLALLLRNFKALKLEVRDYNEVLGASIPTEMPGASMLSERRIFEELELSMEYVLGARVAGDIAEFGTHGRTASVICRKLACFKSDRVVHLFDSFQGFPRATQEGDVDSPHVKNHIWPEFGSAPPVTPEQLRIMLEKYLPAKQLRIYPGWFTDTLQMIPDGTMFSLVHIDCDLYQSTVEVLQALFKRRMVSDGCLVLFDDWDCNNASPKFGERKAWREMVERFNIVYSDAGSYGWCGHKFHVHEYTGMMIA